jgi:hypothetical protein
VDKLNNNIDSAGLRGLICSLSLFENKTAQIYKKIADKVEFPLIKSLLLEISLDSLKHYHLLKGIAESMPKVGETVKECPMKVNKEWDTIESYLADFLKKERIAESDLPELSEKLTLFESVMGEEYDIFIQIKSLELFANEIKHKYNVALDNMHHIFMGIIDDEEHHQEILANIKDIIHQNEQKVLIEDPLHEYRRLGVPSH